MTPLRRRMIEDMRIRNFSPHTQQAYVRYVARFARHYGRSPARLGPKEIRKFQLHLLEKEKAKPHTLVLGMAIKVLDVDGRVLLAATTSLGGKTTPSTRMASTGPGLRV